MQSLPLHAHSLFSGLKNDKYASDDKNLSGRTAIGQTDLRAKRSNTSEPLKPTFLN